MHEHQDGCGRSEQIGWVSEESGFLTQELQPELWVEPGLNSSALTNAGDGLGEESHTAASFLRLNSTTVALTLDPVNHCFSSEPYGLFSHHSCPVCTSARLASPWCVCLLPGNVSGSSEWAHTQEVRTPPGAKVPALFICEEDLEDVH